MNAKSVSSHSLYSDGRQLHLQEQMNPVASHMQPLKLLLLKLPDCAIFRYNIILFWYLFTLDPYVWYHNAAITFVTVGTILPLITRYLHLKFQKEKKNVTHPENHSTTP